jgi:hypothetical protein
MTNNSNDKGTVHGVVIVVRAQREPFFNSSANESKPSHGDDHATEDSVYEQTLLPLAMANEHSNITHSAAKSNVDSPHYTSDTLVIRITFHPVMFYTKSITQLQ